jgi:hypothetical protein
MLGRGPLTLRYIAIGIVRIWFLMLLALTGLVAFGSLIASPIPFVLLAFVLGGMPAPRRITRARWLLWTCGTAVIAAIPVAFLISYGRSEGGVSGPGDSLAVALFLTLVASGLTCIGAGIGRFVWSDA